MQKKIVQKRLLFNLILIHGFFIFLILGVFIFSAHLSRKGIATQITYQMETNLKTNLGHQYLNLSPLSHAIQNEHFNVVGYFDKENKNTFIFPSSKKKSYFSQRSILDRIFNGSIKVPIFFDEQKENLAGTLKYIYPHFTFITFVLFLFCLLVLTGSSFLIRYSTRRWISSLEGNQIKERGELISEVADKIRHDLKSPLQTLSGVLDNSDKISSRDKDCIHSAIDGIKNIRGNLRSHIKKDDEQESIKK